MYEIFADLCEKRGVTPYRVAKECGFSNVTLSDWKNKGSTPKADKLLLISNYLGVSVDYLLTGKETEKESISGKKYYFSDETAEMAQELFENSEMRVLFDVQKDMEPEDMKAMYNMALALKRKERGTDD